jgi:hypothetical protein
VDGGFWVGRVGMEGVYLSHEELDMEEYYSKDFQVYNCDLFFLFISKAASFANAFLLTTWSLGEDIKFHL